MSSRMEGVVGGILVVLVIVAAIATISSFPKHDIAKDADKAMNDGQPEVANAGISDDASVHLATPKKDEDAQLCQCYDDGYKLAGSGVNVLSSQYRAGYEQCRARADEISAQAFTDGWNARLSANSHQANCNVYRASKNL